MATLANGVTNGVHALPGPSHYESQRYSAVPHSIEIPISGGEGEEAVEVDLEELLDDPTELCTLLENENVSRNYWTVIALAYAKSNKIDLAVEIVTKGLEALNRNDPDEQLYLYNCLCWLYLLKSRLAPRVKQDSKRSPNTNVKEHYFKLATSALNDASRINPTFPASNLARGVLCLLRASLIQDRSQKTEILTQSMRAFDAASRGSGKMNTLATLGKARAQYAFGKYAEACQSYQNVLSQAPHLTDPDPRIGIGCCLWRLDQKDEAKVAWERAQEINPLSKSAIALLGVYYLHQSSQYSTSDPEFSSLYKKAMTEYTQKAFKLDNEYPLPCSTFAGYFLARQAWSTVETLARRAIEFTDVYPIASDGWYMLARKEHSIDEAARAADCYNRADQARGGDDRGYLPAKIGGAQLRIAQRDVDGAKFRLEKLGSSSTNAEAMSLLGALFADDVFTGKADATDDGKTSAKKKAIAVLETVRRQWRDPKLNIPPESSVLLNLARLYEGENPDKSLACLQQAEQIELDEIPENLRADGTEDNGTWLNIMRQHVTPQLLNNLASFLYHTERYAEASALLQSASQACAELDGQDAKVDKDALITTVSYNLGRVLEAQDLLDEAKKVYNGLIERHPQHIEANIRLTYIELIQNPSSEGPASMKRLMSAHGSNVEVRALQGWYLKKAKKRTLNINEDEEQRHHKHTLQDHNKHDYYALVGVGNSFLSTAREMRPSTSEDMQRRSAMYTRAVEAYDKALNLDPKNAYAAQGIAIAYMEDKHDFKTAVGIFSQLKDTIKGPCVYMNLGHCFAESGQWARSIENYEAALARARGRDIPIMICLARAWSLRGGKSGNVDYLRSALEYSQQVLNSGPNQPQYIYNKIFVHQQIARALIRTSQSNKSLVDLQQALKRLEEANASLEELVNVEPLPFSRELIEVRLRRGRGDLLIQLRQAIEKQKAYEESNASRLQQARERRDQELAKRAEEQRKRQEAENERRRLVAEERRKMQEHDRELAEKRAEEERRRKEEQEMSLDEDGREKRSKRSKQSSNKRKKKSEDFIVESDVEEGEDGIQGSRSPSATPARSDTTEAPRKIKKRKLERRGKESKAKSKFKSAEFINSDEDDNNDDDDDDQAPEQTSNRSDRSKSEEPDVKSGNEGDSSATPRPSKRKRIVDDDDEDEGEGEPPAQEVNANGEKAANGADAMDESE